MLNSNKRNNMTRSLFVFVFFRLDITRRYFLTLCLYFTGSFEVWARRMALDAFQKRWSCTEFFDACSLFCCCCRYLSGVHDTFPPITNGNRTVVFCTAVAHWPVRQASSASLPISRTF